MRWYVYIIWGDLINLTELGQNWVDAGSIGRLWVAFSQGWLYPNVPEPDRNRPDASTVRPFPIRFRQSIAWCHLITFFYLVSIGWGYDLAPDRRQAITWTNDDSGIHNSSVNEQIQVQRQIYIYTKVSTIRHQWMKYKKISLKFNIISINSMKILIFKFKWNCVVLCRTIRDATMKYLQGVTMR